MCCSMPSSDNFEHVAYLKFAEFRDDQQGLCTALINLYLSSGMVNSSESIIKVPSSFGSIIGIKRENASSSTSFLIPGICSI